MWYTEKRKGRLEMTLQQLRYFLSVADSLSFTKAAKENYVSQTAVTRQIQILERELGVSLFARSTAHVKLTAAGTAFCTACQEIVRIWERAASDVRQIARDRTITLALPTAVEQEIAAGLVRGFREEHPEVSFSFVGGVRQELMNDLVENKIDLLISMALDLPDLGGLQKLSLPPAHAVLMMSSLHPLAKCPCVSPSQLEGETLVASRSSSVAPTRERMDAYYRKLGLGKNPVAYTDTFSSMVLMVETGIGVAVVPSNLRNRLSSGLCFAELEGPWQQMDFVALCMPDNPNPCAQDFFAFLSRYKKEDEMRKEKKAGEGTAARYSNP